MKIVHSLAAVVLILLAVPAAAQPIPAPPAIDARSHILIDHQSGQVLVEHAADTPMEPASLTKIMTSYVVFHEIQAGKAKLDDQVPISERAWRTPGSRTFVEVGTEVSVEDLLKGVIIQSGNDASVALAEHFGGTEEGFATLMNHYAAQLGMRDSHFVNATGLPDPQHYTTARDLANLSRALIAEFPQWYEWYAVREFSYNGIKQYNRNTLLRDPSVDGIKTGHTEAAGFCLVASAKRADTRLISVVLGTTDEKARARYSQALLEHGFRFYETHRLYSATQPLTQARVWKGAVESVPLGLDQDLYVTIPRGRYDALNANMLIETRIVAPAHSGDSFGRVEVTLDGEVVAERPLIALQDIAEGSLWQRLADDVWMRFQ